VTRYHVRIEFREPTYELRAGPKPEPYLFGYDVEAASESEAEQLALLEFRETAKLSNVSWIRQVLRVIVTLTPGPAEPAEDPSARPSASITSERPRRRQCDKASRSVGRTPSRDARHATLPSQATKLLAVAVQAS